MLELDRQVEGAMADFWFVDSDRKACGPIAPEEFRKLIANGSVTPQTLSGGGVESTGPRQQPRAGGTRSKRKRK